MASDEVTKVLSAKIKSLENTLQGIRSDEQFPVAIKQAMEKELADARKEFNSTKPSLSRHTALGHKLQ
eukprot:2842484-Pyramimonas_sp.AAC.1